MVAVLVGCMILAARYASAADWLGFVQARKRRSRCRRLGRRQRWCVQAGVDDTGDDPATVLVSAEASPDDACAEEAEGCQDALQRLMDDRLASIDLDIRVGGRAGNDYPCECRLEGETYQPRRFASTTFTWTAAGYCHKPLYFEHWQLERYGHSYGPLGILHLGSPLLRDAARAALQDGGRVALGVHVPARPLPTRQLRSLDRTRRPRSAPAALRSRLRRSRAWCSCSRSVARGCPCHVAGRFATAIQAFARSEMLSLRHPGCARSSTPAPWTRAAPSRLTAS